MSEQFFTQPILNSPYQYTARHQAYLLGMNNLYKALKTTLKAEIGREGLYRGASRPFAKPTSGRIAVNVINPLGDEVMKMFSVS